MRRATHRSARSARWLAGLSCLCYLLAGPGCGKKGPKLYPVEGKVTVAGTALTTGYVALHPEPPQESAQRGGAIATVQADGTYKVTTNGKEGAPPGRYKVTVSTMVPPGANGVPPSEDPVQKDKGTRPLTRATPVNPRYLAPTTTTLTIEVVENPSAGAYDLKLLR